MIIAERYSRNLPALSPEECAALAHKRVAVVGCGGLGGLVIETLARIGVGYLRVIDGDTFEEGNLNRQLLCTEATIGREKVLVAAERVAAINSEVSVEPVVARLDESNAGALLAGVDCVVDCLDNLESRFQAAKACQTLGTPIVHGAIAGWVGQLCTVFPGDASFATVYALASDENLGEKRDVSQASTDRLQARGSLPFTAYSIAAAQAAETVKVLLERPGQLRNRLLVFDLLDGFADEIELR